MQSCTAFVCVDTPYPGDRHNYIDLQDAIARYPTPACAGVTCAGVICAGVTTRVNESSP